MYLIAIGWIYVALMMSVAEATNTNGTVLGAIFTFLLYGLGPTALVMYLLGTPARKRARREREAADLAAWKAQQQAAVDAPAAAQAEAPAVPNGPASNASGEPDAGRLPSAGAVAPVRKEP